MVKKRIVEREVGVVEKRMEVCGGEVGVGENGRCVEENWVRCGVDWEVWRGKVGVVKRMGGVWRGKVGVIGVERKSGCG